MEEKVSGFPKYFPFRGDRIYEVLGYADKTITEYVDNAMYINPEDECLYVCSYKKEPIHDDVPIVFVEQVMGKDGKEWKLKFQEAPSPAVMTSFHVSNVYELNLDKILEDTTGDEVLYNEEVLADLNAATTIFHPVINPKDDPLKKIIKQAIIDKEIDITSLKHKLPHKYALTNMKSALVGKTKMSITNFTVWCDLLNLHFDVMVYDKGGMSSHKLNKPIHFNSESWVIEKE